MDVDPKGARIVDAMQRLLDREPFLADELEKLTRVSLSVKMEASQYVTREYTARGHATAVFQVRNALANVAARKRSLEMLYDSMIKMRNAIGDALVAFRKDGYLTGEEWPDVPFLEERKNVLDYYSAKLGEMLASEYAPKEDA